MKQFGKVVLWIAILVGVGFGVYTVLPEYPHNLVKSIVQPVVDSESKVMIEKVKGLTNKDLNKATYKDILEKNAHNSCWTYESSLKSTDGLEHVYFYGRGLSLNLKDWEEYGGQLYTSAMVKIDFKINGGNVEIVPSVDGKEMLIIDGKHVEQNDKIKLDILSQMSTGMKEEK